MKRIKLHWQVLIALILAVIFGVFFKEYIKYVSWMGTIFMNALKMIIIPLVLSSIISGITNIKKGSNIGRLGVKTIFYYIITSFLAIITGLFFINVIHPGISLHLVAQNFTNKGADFSTLTDTLLNIIPDNIFVAFTKNKMLSVIFIALLFGFFITKINDKPRIFLTDLFNSVFEVIMKITMFIIKFTPLGIFGLVAKVVSEQDNLLDLAENMGLYMLTIILALSVHFFITLPLIIKFVGKVNPLKHLQAMTTALFTAFSTSSSGATLPLTMECVEHNSGVSNKITSFTLPLGATINMDGTALYECVAAIFIAQAYGIDLNFAQQCIIVFTALIASIGAASIPMAGLFMITIILTAVGLPLDGIGLILSVDRILDMFRTTTNVWSDSCCAVVIAKTEGEKLKV